MASEAGWPLLWGGRALKPFIPRGAAMLGTPVPPMPPMPGGVLVPTHTFTYTDTHTHTHTHIHTHTHTPTPPPKTRAPPPTHRHTHTHTQTHTQHTPSVTHRCLSPSRHQHPPGHRCHRWHWRAQHRSPPRDERLQCPPPPEQRPFTYRFHI